MKIFVRFIQQKRTDPTQSHLLAPEPTPFQFQLFLVSVGLKY